MKKLLAVFVMVLLAATAQAATLSPMPRLFFRNAAGTSPLSFGKIYTYSPGTSTPKATYTDSTGSTENLNPLQLDAGGGATFFLSGCYDFLVTTSAGVPLYTTPNVCEYEEATASSALTPQWNASGITPVFLGTTSFSTAGDYTDVFEPGLRLKSTTTAGTIYSTVVSAVYAATVTTVTVVNDSGVLDSGLSEVQISVLTVANPSIPIVPVATKTTGYTILPADCGKTIVGNLSSAATFTLPAASAVPSNCTITTKGTGTGALTLSGSIDNFTSIVVSNGTTTTPFYGEATVFSSGSTSWFLRSAKGIPDESNVLRTASTVTAPNVMPVTGADGQIPLAFIPSTVSLVTGTTGTNTWIVPNGITRMWAFLRGGGAGGATSGGGGSGAGGGAGYSISWFPLSVSSGQTVTCFIGSGGTTGANGASSYIYAPTTGMIIAGGGIAGTAGSTGGTTGSLGWSSSAAVGTGGGTAQSDYREDPWFWPYYGGTRGADYQPSGGDGTNAINTGGGNGGGIHGGTGGNGNPATAGADGLDGYGSGGGGGGGTAGALGGLGGAGYCYLMYW